MRAPGFELMVEVCNRRWSAFGYWTGEPVEHVMATRMTFRQEWMFEVVGGRMCHPDAFHYFSRALIGGNRKRHDFSQPKLAEAIVTCSASGSGVGYCCGLYSVGRDEDRSRVLR